MTATLQLLAARTQGKSRHETLHGRDYLVVPMVMMTEGVHNGSNGPLYYPAEEMQKCIPAVWNAKPIVVYHPHAGTSACDPTVMNTQGVGMVMNTAFRPAKGKLKAAWTSEAWLEVSRLEQVDNRVLEAIEADSMMEISTGLFTENEAAAGEFAGKKYSYIARGYKPDHLAILPDKTGACSVADGAGLLRLNEEGQKRLEALGPAAVATAEGLLNDLTTRLGQPLNNEASFGEVQSELYTLVRERYGEGYWVMDVWSNEFVYSSKDGKYWRRGWATKDGKTVITDKEPVEVKRVMTYKPVANTEQPAHEEPMLTKKDKIDQLIANSAGAWVEADRPTLEAMTDAVLDKVVANAKAAPAASAAPTTTPPPAPAAPVPAANAAAPPQAPAAPMTVAQYIAAAPPAVQGALQYGMALVGNEKAKAIARITANTSSTFTKEQLEAKDLPELQAIAALCPDPAAPAPVANGYNPGGYPWPQPVPHYMGSAGAAPVANAAAGGVEEPLPIPTLSWDAPK